uniref:Uncharacterized protein n=1 Tax=Rhizophora mucronata TaxID=61149 RepID=A0A2P2IM17_RHIMU
MHASHSLFNKNRRWCSFPLGIGIREHLPNIRVTQCPRYGIHNTVQQHISIRMSHAAFIVRHINPTNDQRVARLQPVDIEPEAGPERQRLGWLTGRFWNIHGGKCSSCRYGKPGCFPERQSCCCCLYEEIVTSVGRPGTRL